MVEKPPAPSWWHSLVRQAGARSIKVMPGSNRDARERPSRDRIPRFGGEESRLGGAHPCGRGYGAFPSMVTVPPMAVSWATRASASAVGSAML